MTAISRIVGWGRLVRPTTSILVRPTGRGGPVPPAGMARREVIRGGLALGGMGAAAAAIWGTVPKRAAAAETGTLTLDVACLGDTFRVVAPEGASFPDMNDASKPFDARGATFSVEGTIYPEGRIEGDGFDPASAEADAIGPWFCRGWFVFHSGRPEPHVITTQEYVLGPITEAMLFPPDQLVSSGMEGAEGERLDALRSVIGGAGKYAGATGVVNQKGNGTNTTEIPGFGNAPNFRFVFEV